MDDLVALALDDEDLSELSACRLGRCGLKLSGDEMREMQYAASGAGADWKVALQQAFRGAVHMNA